MEDTLRAITLTIMKKKQGSLNPCFNGRYSQSFTKAHLTAIKAGLNPCFNGRYSQSQTSEADTNQWQVLILVLMEDTLRVQTSCGLTACYEVLILVLMEDTLRVQRLVSLCLSSFDVCLPL